MKQRVRMGYRFSMVCLAGIALLISLAGTTLAGNEGDAHWNVFYGTGAGANLPSSA